jgi:hypothetical protein
VIRGEDRGIVAEAGRRNRVEDPEVPPGDGEAGRPVAEDLLTNDVFEHALGAADVGFELGRGLAISKDMEVAMAGDLMPGRPCALDERRVLSRHPTQEKHGGSDIRLRQ